MSLYKRYGNYYIDFINASGQRIRQSTETTDKSKAQELHDRLKAESWAVKKTGEKVRRTWQETVVRWLNENSHKRSLRTDKEILRYLNQHLQDKQLDEINRTMIDIIKNHKQSTGVSNATVNRVLSLIRSVLNTAMNDWEWIDSVPTIRLLNEKSGRTRWLTHQEADRLLDELPEHLEAMARFALATGLRASNVTGLLWEQVDLFRRCAWIFAEQAKGNRAISVPLNDDAMSIVKHQIGKHKTNVFTYKGKSVGIANTKAFRAALARAEIDDFCWHDLRHTWASWHVQGGTPLHVLKELGGWADLKMVLRYAHLSSEHLSAYASNSNHGTNMTHSQKSPADENRRRA
jgi:integrase